MSKKSACRIICTGTPENGGMAGTIPSLFFQKGRQQGQRCIFIIGIRASTFWGAIFCLKDFYPQFPKLAWKIICATFTCNCSPTNIIKTFSGVTSKNGLHVFFCKPSATFFEIKHRILPRFSANQNFSNTTAFHNSIIGNFVIYQDQRETNLL